jgi:hypothetical protein
MKKQQAAQCKGAAGAVHGSRFTSEKGAGMPVQRDVLAAHYEISGGHLTKSLLIFCCAGLIGLISGRLAFSARAASIPPGPRYFS